MTLICQRWQKMKLLIDNSKIPFSKVGLPNLVELIC